jgi:E3 ubiquitin-protein ligase UBR3
MLFFVIKFIWFLLQGMSQSGVTAREMITLLAGQDRTHSQLMDALPEKCGLSGVTKDYEPILAQVH